MKYSILTLFPEMFEALNTSIIKRAIQDKKIEIDIIDIRKFSNNKHNKVDSTPYGGGPGMVLMPNVAVAAVESVKGRTKTIYVSPKGKKLDSKLAKELAKEEHLCILCGHYEGIDERIIDLVVDEEISIGDYVLTGGELPAMVILDTTSRYVDGVIKEESALEDSFENNLLEYPQYTKPQEFRNLKVPDVYLSGNHKEIEKERFRQSIYETYTKRPDLLEKLNKDNLTKTQKEILKQTLEELNKEN